MLSSCHGYPVRGPWMYSALAPRTCSLTGFRLAGFVFFPRILPESLQRALVIETLSHAGQPNLTSLDNHYELPSGGLWAAWRDGRGDEVVSQKVAAAPAGASTSATGLSTVHGTPEELKRIASASSASGAIVSELLPKLRWANVGWHYNVSLAVCFRYSMTMAPYSLNLHSGRQSYTNSSADSRVYLR